MKTLKKTFLIKRLVIDSFDNKGNGTIEETLRLKHPYLLKTKNGTGHELCKSLRELFFTLITSKNEEKRVVLPEGTRMVHIKTNADKKRTVSCIVIFNEDLKYDTDDKTTRADEGEIGWDL
jgi:hypothetical protein